MDRHLRLLEHGRADRDNQTGGDENPAGVSAADSLVRRRDQEKEQGRRIEVHDAAERLVHHEHHDGEGRSVACQECPADAHWHSR
jgi:hypothetical protein